MFQVVLGILGVVASLLISSWLYREFIVLFPDAEEPIQEVADKVRIPTHDQWDMEVVEPYVERTKSHLGELSKSVDLSAAGKFVTDLLPGEEQPKVQDSSKMTLPEVDPQSRAPQVDRVLRKLESLD